jgi:hypothetical protein
VANRRRAPDKFTGGISGARTRTGCCERFSAASNPGAASRQARCCLDRRIMRHGSTRHRSYGDRAGPPVRGRPVVAQPRPAPREASPVPTVRPLGSKINDATIASSGTFLHEATRTLSFIVALQPHQVFTWRQARSPSKTMAEARQFVQAVVEAVVAAPAVGQACRRDASPSRMWASLRSRSRTSRSGLAAARTPT